MFKPGDRVRILGNNTIGKWKDAEFIVGTRNDVYGEPLLLDNQTPLLDNGDRPDRARGNFWWPTNDLELVTESNKDPMTESDHIEVIKVSAQVLRSKGYSVNIEITEPPKTYNL